ncbi:MAG TPA: hypothetical protein VJQ47_12190 [Steroidobacteraceae bacterium]|nr:hypothetical protein [Steroidobacteraceae bacterium]
MLPKPLPVDFNAMPHTRAGDIMRDHRARVALEEEARAQKRRLDAAEQCSSANPPAARIRAWEQVHGLRLPSSEAHPILEVIAVGTCLTLAEVRQEQRARVGARARL